MIKGCLAWALTINKENRKKDIPSMFSTHVRKPLEFNLVRLHKTQQGNEATQEI